MSATDTEGFAPPPAAQYRLPYTAATMRAAHAEADDVPEPCSAEAVEYADEWTVDAAFRNQFVMRTEK